MVGGGEEVVGGGGGPGEEEVGVDVVGDCCDADGVFLTPYHRNRHLTIPQHFQPLPLIHLPLLLVLNSLMHLPRPLLIVKHSRQFPLLTHRQLRRIYTLRHTSGQFRPCSES